MSIKNLVLIILSFFLFGCYSTQSQAPVYRSSSSDNIVYDSYKIVEELENNLRQPISQDDPIIVASFVDVSDLTKSSGFGRIMAEQIGSRLAQKGYKIVEVKLRQYSIFVDPENKGEFLLSRNIKDISAAHNASVVVVGTYAEGNESVYVSARMVNPVDSIVMSSCDRNVKFKSYREMTSLMK